MAAFIAWLYAQIGKVQDWFSDAYYTLRNAAANAWNWAISAAEDALNRARSYAYTLLQNALNGLNEARDWLTQQIADIRSSIYDDITGVINWVEYKINSIVDAAGGVIGSAIEAVMARILAIRDNIINFATNIYNWAWERVLNGFGWLLEIRQKILAIIEALTGQGLSRLLTIIRDLYSNILLFFSNPVVFIFDILREKFISYLCFILAHALGTTKQDLPQIPPWRN